MNQKLKSLFAAELIKFQQSGIVGEATKNYLLNYDNSIKIPNVIYCVLTMLGTEYENHDVSYKEYRSSCQLWDHNNCCQTFAVNEGIVSWYFWYINQDDMLDITGVPKNSVSNLDCICLQDNKENVILLNLYAKLAYQCMGLYDTRYKCYLPLAFFRMAKYILFLLSTKAFYAAIESAIRHHGDEEINYIIREVLETVLGLDEVDPGDIYSVISRMRGNEKAALCRIIASWDLGGDLRKELKKIVDEFLRMLSSSMFCELIKGREEEVRYVLGEELFYQVQIRYQKNATIR